MKPCVKCGATDRHTDGRCRPCAKASTAKWQAENKDRVKANKSAYNLTDKRKAQNKNWYEVNKEKCAENNAKWRLENIDRFKAVQKTWEADHKESRKLITQKRRAKIANVGGRLSIGLGEKLLKLQNGKCAICKCDISQKNHLDHIVPLAIGGPNKDENIQLLCPTCNHSKSAKHPVDFMQSRGFLL